MTQSTKCCRQCNETKELSMFANHKAMKDGHLNICKACKKTYLYAWRKTPEGIKMRNKHYVTSKPKLGIDRTWEEYIQEKQKHAIGRKAVLHNYNSKRRVRKEIIELSDFDLFVIAEATELVKAREKSTGIKWHIDHIVPLQHKEACGLHNAYNVQVVPASWNVKKGNRNMDVYFNIEI